MKISDQNVAKPTLGLNEWQKIKPDNFIERVGEISLTEKDITLCESLANKGFIDIIEHKNGVSIQTTSYVGRISLESFDLQINPKLDELPLINFFKYGYQLKNLHLFSQHDLKNESLAIQDIIIQQLLSEVKLLLQKGLFQEYQRRNQQLSTIRGRIDFKKYFSSYSVASNLIPCVYHPRTLDNPLNQFIQSGLQFASRITDNQMLKLECLRFSNLVPADSNGTKNLSILYKQVVRKSSRLNNHYQPAVNIILLLMNGQGAFIEGQESDVAISGFLFDMNCLFQNVISRFLNEHVNRYDIFDELSLQGMMSYAPEYNPKNKRNPLPRPDFVIKDKGATKAILDAKYRDLWEKTLPREMLYQLGMYALVHNNVRGSTILYPTTSTEASEERIIINDPVSRDFQGSVTIRPVNVHQFDDLIQLPTSKPNSRMKEQYANYMVFGNKFRPN
jgi:5-methylcytosine-specific restriction enzyme subunit McrC